MYKHKIYFIISLIWLIIMSYPIQAGTKVSNSKLPEGFVYLHEIDSSIISSLKYFSNDNFVGSRINGYKLNVVILTPPAALALKEVQRELKNIGYSLVVYDAYRPKKAVAHFMAWAKDNSLIKQALFYPALSKSEIISGGYVAPLSSHSRGSTVDLTIIPLDQILYQSKEIKVTLQDGKQIIFNDDGTLNMGTHFDFFGEASHHDSKLVTAEQLERRNILRSVMIKNGFKDYQQEWWHYTLANEPFPNDYFDFDIE